MLPYIIDFEKNYFKYDWELVCLVLVLMILKGYSKKSYLEEVKNKIRNVSSMAKEL